MTTFGQSVGYITNYYYNALPMITSHLIRHYIIRKHEEYYSSGAFQLARVFRNGGLFLLSSKGNITATAG